jgi:hypothetical protein
MKRLFLFISLLIHFISQAQTCDRFPADCPETTNIENTRDSNACITNWVAPKEITMQNHLRKFITDMMEDIGRKKKWEMYEYTELPGVPLTSDDNQKLLSYPLRPPYQYSITFVFIVNEDSLKAWQNWYHNDLLQQSNNVVASYEEAKSNTSGLDAHQRYTDSANYYGTQMAKYMTTHQDEYQKAIASNDAKGQKKYEDGLKKIQDKINEYISKANNMQGEIFSSADSKTESLQEYRKRKTIAYRNASTLRVSFVFNASATASLAESCTLVKTLNVPNASYSVEFHNSEPDETRLVYSFLTNPDFAFVLFGKWNTNLDEYNSYRASYTTDKAATDYTTVKKIPSDKLQTTSVGIEGTTTNINQFLQSFESQKLNALITRQ